MQNSSDGTSQVLNNPSDSSCIGKVVLCLQAEGGADPDTLGIEEPVLNKDCIRVNVDVHKANNTDDGKDIEPPEAKESRTRLKLHMPDIVSRRRKAIRHGEPHQEVCDGENVAQNALVHNEEDGEDVPLLPLNFSEQVEDDSDDSMIEFCSGVCDGDDLLDAAGDVHAAGSDRLHTTADLPHVQQVDETEVSPSDGDGDCNLQEEDDEAQVLISAVLDVDERDKTQDDQEEMETDADADKLPLLPLNSSE